MTVAMLEDAAIRPFHLAIPDVSLDDLRYRLRQTRWPKPYTDENWAEGTDAGYLQGLCRYWSEGYDWRAREQEINRFPQFVTQVAGLDIHFVHIRSERPNAVPILIVHGWPGSFLEMLHLAKILACPVDNDDLAFDVVVPSIPGYGGSQAPASAGLTPAGIADIFTSLMIRLGYPRFFAQGGDLGSTITTWIARSHPEKVAGLHLNLFPGALRPTDAELDLNPLTDNESSFLDAARWFAEDSGGYMHMHRTRPQTLAYGLTDSPAGLAGWIVEKFRAWSDCGGALESLFERDALLDNISLYWFTNTIASSIRLYRESSKSPLHLQGGALLTTPLGFAQFPAEISKPPREWISRFFADIRQFTIMPKGGHFAALEQPHALADDMRRLFKPLSKNLSSDRPSAE